MHVWAVVQTCSSHGWWSQPNENPFNLPSTPNTYPLHFSTYLQIIKWMNLIELIHLTIWTVLQKTLKYFQLFDRNCEEYAEQKVARTHFLVPNRGALTNILPQFQTSLYIIFHCLKFPIHFCVSLDRWQADTDDRQIYIRRVTQEQFHTERGRLPILSSIWALWLYKQNNNNKILLHSQINFSHVYCWE